MDYKINTPARIQGAIALPRSKSISNRVLLIQALCHTPFPIEQLSASDDTQVLAQAIAQWTHASKSQPLTIDVGAAGTAYRFLTAFLAQSPGTYILTGSARMKQRPIKLLVEALRKQGASIDYLEQETFPPLHIQGRPLEGGEVHISGAISSQYISALLLSAPVMKGGMQLIINQPLTSKPYVSMTLRIMEQFGIHYTWSGANINIPQQAYCAKPFLVEADWSAASYWYELLSFYDQGELFLQGLLQDSLQGDAKVAELFAHLGVQTEYESQGVRIRRQGEAVKEMHWDFVEQPDLAQTLVVTCVCLGIPFHFKGLSTLKVKETNRIQALIVELAKCGFVLHEPQDGELAWDKTQCTPQELPRINTYEDHRMAMSFAPLAKFRPLIIQDVAVVSKSYPQFWENLQEKGVSLEVDSATKS